MLRGGIFPGVLRTLKKCINGPKSELLLVGGRLDYHTPTGNHLGFKNRQKSVFRDVVWAKGK